MLRATLTLIAALLLTSPAMAQPTSRFVDVDGTAIHYAVAGNGGDTILFVHGWSCDGSAWDAQVADLSTRYRIVTIDLPGHGKSAAPKDGVYSMARFARAIDGVRAKEKIDRLILAGHSMGAVVIARYAQDFPAHTAGLILVDGMLPPVDVRAPMRATVSADTPAEPKERAEFIKSMFSPATTPELKRRLLSMMSTPTTATARGAMLAMFDNNVLSEEPVKAPAVLIAADRPEQPRLDFTRKIFPALRIVTMAGVGHFLMMEKPAEFNSLLREALATLRK
jgi:pimeloyl-ACP methyl ester carboxylesterase